MVLKCIGMSSSDQIPIHKNWCLILKVFRFSDGYLGLDNENVYSSHTFCNPLVILLSFFLYKN